MRRSNTEMFESKRKVHQVIEDGSYIQFLKDWQPRMRKWKEKFDQTQSMYKYCSRTALVLNVYSASESKNHTSNGV
jgi:hypothetical protein